MFPLLLVVFFSDRYHIPGWVWASDRSHNKVKVIIVIVRNKVNFIETPRERTISNAHAQIHPYFHDI